MSTTLSVSPSPTHTSFSKREKRHHLIHPADEPHTPSPQTPSAEPAKTEMDSITLSPQSTTTTRKTKTKDEIAEAYVSEPWWYDIRGFFILTFAYQSTLWAQMKFFGANFGKKHLEVACGTGTLLQLMLWWRWALSFFTSNKSDEEPHITGLDYAESMLAGARHRFSSYSKDQMVFLHADAAAMPLESNSYDTINVANAVHCFPDVDGALADMTRVLKPGGTMAINVLLYPTGIFGLRHIAQAINTWGIKKGILVTPYHQDDIHNRIVAAGLEITQEWVSGNCLNVLAKKPLRK